MQEHEQEQEEKGKNEYFVTLAAMIASFLFAVHPIHTEAVSGLVSRADLMAAIFMIWACLCHEQSTLCSQPAPGSAALNSTAPDSAAPDSAAPDSAALNSAALDISKTAKRKKIQIGHVVWTSLSLWCSIFASLSKETGVTILSILFLLELLLPPSPPHSPLTTTTTTTTTPTTTPTTKVSLSLFKKFTGGRPIILFAHILTGFIYFIARKIVQGEASLRKWQTMENHLYLAEPSVLRTLTLMHTHAQYLSMMVWPKRGSLAYDHGFNTST